MRLPLCICLGFFTGSAVSAAALPGVFLTEAVWHDNVTNAELPADVIGALEWRTEWQAVFHRALPGGHRLSLRARLRSEIWPRFDALNLIAPGVTGTWQYKPGLGPHVPVFTFEVDGEWAAVSESARAGRGGAARLQVGQRLGTEWLLTGGFERRRFDARSHAFDLTAREWFGRVERTLGENWMIALETRWREGVVISYSHPPRPDLVAIGKPVTLVGTFEQSEPWIAYYFRAHTRSGALELQRTFGRAAVALRYEYRETTHNGPGYLNQLTTLRCTARF